MLVSRHFVEPLAEIAHKALVPSDVGPVCFQLCQQSFVLILKRLDNKVHRVCMLGAFYFSHILLACVDTE